MKITYAAATSLDQFIAREDGDVSWLDDLNIDMKETGLEEFFESIDGLLMGRKTYDFVFNYGTWPYGDKPTWVCTSREVELMDGANLIVMQDLEPVFEDVKRRGMKHLWLVGGGRLASACLEKGLITNISISEMPVTLGSGIPLFSDHVVDNLEFQERTVVEKKGFRQLEFVL